MKRSTRGSLAVGLGVLVAAAALAVFGEGESEAAKGTSPATASGEVVDVELCDGDTRIQVAANDAKSPADGKKIADELMAQWRRKNPQADWISAEREKHKIVPPHDNSGLIGENQGHVYGRITKQDVVTWERETLAMVTHGSTVFHSADELGSTIAVSCDMCHPDAANTHPETYPKYQVQLGRTVLLRDMINWCIEHPVRGKKLDPDDPKMRGLEAYIMAQRKGAKMEYGKR